VLAGNLMNAIGITERIFNLANALVGHFRAGLAQVNVLASVLLAGGTGAAVADIAGLGAVEIKAMRERATAAFSSAITVVSAIVAPFIPPSVPLVVYAFLSNTSVARMFLAGVVPGLVIAAVADGLQPGARHRVDFPRQERASAGEVWSHTISGGLRPAGARDHHGRHPDGDHHRVRGRRSGGGLQSSFWAPTSAPSPSPHSGRR
jgi:TRAP-type C4-dicarboxylate transport system permease large subunit